MSIPPCSPKEKRCYLPISTLGADAYSPALQAPVPFWFRGLFRSFLSPLRRRGTFFGGQAAYVPPCRSTSFRFCGGEYASAGKPPTPRLVAPRLATLATADLPPLGRRGDEQPAKLSVPSALAPRLATLATAVGFRESSRRRGAISAHLVANLLLCALPHRQAPCGSVAFLYEDILSVPSCVRTVVSAS